jgi:hypothetical protein
LIPAAAALGVFVLFGLIFRPGKDRNDSAATLGP